MDKIKVAIVEDDLEFQKAMVGFINRQPDMLVIGAASNKADAVNLAKTLTIDVILMDINLNGNESDGIIGALEILQFSETQIIMLTGIEDASTIMDSFTAGAINYVLKENYNEIPNIIRQLHQYDTPYKLLIKEFSRLKKEELLKDLSRPEKEIFHLIEKGHTQAEIAEILFKTQNTIKTQIKKILRKLEVSNTKDAVKKVSSKGILEKSKEGKELPY